MAQELRCATDSDLSALEEGVSSTQHPSLSSLYLPSSLSPIAFASGSFCTLHHHFISLSSLMSSLEPDASLHHFLSICLPFVYWEYFLLSQLVSSHSVSGYFNFLSVCDTCKLHELFLNNIPFNGILISC